MSVGGICNEPELDGRMRSKRHMSILSPRLIRAVRKATCDLSHMTDMWLKEHWLRGCALGRCSAGRVSRPHLNFRRLRHHLHDHQTTPTDTLHLLPIITHTTVCSFAIILHPLHAARPRCYRLPTLQPLFRCHRLQPPGHPLPVPSFHVGPS